MSQNTTRNQQKRYQVDKRKAEDICNRIAKLSSYYTPEWHFSKDDPDIGSVIGILFAKQMEGNIDRYNQVLDKYHTEFVNLLDISLKPAKPARSVVLLGLIQNLIPGSPVPKGSKLLTDADAGDPIVFETDFSVYVTNADITDAFLTDKDDGDVIPLKGDFEAPAIVLPEQVRGEQEQEEETEENTPSPLFGEEEPEVRSARGWREFTLFDETGGIHKNALLFYHDIVFDVVNEDIYVKIVGNDRLLEKIREGAFSFLYYSGDGLLPFGYVEFKDDGTIVLRKSEENRKLVIEGKEYSLLALVANEPIRENYELEDILFSTAGEPTGAVAVNNGATDYDVTDFDLFGDTLSLYAECYIGHDTYFAKQGSLITIDFDVTYPEHRLEMSLQQINDELKIIKKKPKSFVSDAMAEVFAEEISIEYYNGIGWKKLNCRQEYKTMFARIEQGHYTLSFICPKDWTETDAGAYEGRCLRLQLLRSDNCYIRPAIHHYPHIRNLKIAFSYEQQYVPAARAVAIMGSTRVPMTSKMGGRGRFTAFSVSRYMDDALYLGFDKKLENGPISILFMLKDGTQYEGVKTVFEYATAKGFKQLKVLDYTQDFSRSGIVLFMPQADMKEISIEGRKRYWIRIRRTDVPHAGEYQPALPVISDIKLNAVMVSNIETGMEQDFYLEDLTPFMHFALPAENILDMDVWVNEKGYLTPLEVSSMLEQDPDRVRVEYDVLGEIQAVYIKWSETESFEDSDDRRVYEIDRMNNEIIFGDGVHTDLPRVMDDVAFKAVIRSCNGDRGNVAEGMIVDSATQLTYIGDINNPVRAFGGSNIEDFESALERGANILRSRKRLVSSDDYEREIMTYSDNIDQVKCIAGRLRDGSFEERALSFVVLLKDYQEGAFSFQGLSGALRRHLLEKCALTVSEEDIHIVEPMFVDISVDLWVESVKMDDTFEVQNVLQDCLRQYLEPLKSESGAGWRIGTLPQKSPILMKLNILKSRAIVKKLAIIAKYTDETGVHEVDLDDVDVTPFMICRSGEHHVHVLVDED
ncbi:MAG: hypothetical protein E7300_02305 [Lachnospiraceae bacterium]|nr:hypothetical protein [Lachnospiraceae bacterium]